MSSRQLKKLRKQQELQNIQDEAVRAEESEEESPVTSKPRASVFSSFAALGDAGDEEDEDTQAEQDDITPVEEPEKPTAQPLGSGKKAKKSKKKKKAKGYEIPQSAEPEKDDGGIDEIDRALAELNMNRIGQGNSPSAVDSSRKGHERLAELLRINYNHLRAINEMRNLFGKEAIEAARAEDEAEASNNRRRQRQRPQQVDLETYLKGIPGKSLSDTILRRNPFIQGKPTWPRASAGGLTMKVVTDTKQNYTEFTFSHDKSYDALEGVFFNLVHMHDPMQIVHFLHRNPYHVSSLIQVSKVAKQDQNSALSADLCERALFTFGRVTLSSFRQKLEQGKARLDFRRPENRQFWLAAYNYLKTLFMKGTYRTALEWAKLVYSLDPDDPYALINWIHVLSIRAYQAQWFIDFYNTRHRCWDENDVENLYVRQTLVLAKIQIDDFAGAMAELVRGMQEVPWLYCELFSSLGLDAPKAIWGVQPRDEDEELQTRLYIHVAKDLWSNPQTIALLKEASNMAAKRDISSLPKTPPVSLATARFVYLDNTPALMAHVPRGMLHASPNFDFDPLPPSEEENVFSSDIQKAPWHADEFWQRANNLDPGRRGARGDEGDGNGLGGMMPGALPEEPLAFEEIDPDAESAEVRGVLQRFIEIFWPGWSGYGGGDEDEDQTHGGRVEYVQWDEGENPWSESEAEEHIPGGYHGLEHDDDDGQDGDHPPAP